MTRWWTRENLARRRPYLLARGAISAAVRAFFAARGFVEVETPALQLSPGMEVHLNAFATEWRDPLAGSRQARYLHTSPEFAMKKLLAAGEPRIFQLARVWRNAEHGPTHHPEFTMLEWYRHDAGWEALVEDCEGLLRATLAAVPPDLSQCTLRWNGRLSDPAQPFERLSVAEAFARWAGIDLLATAPNAEAPDRAALAAQARAIGIAARPAESWEDLFFRIFLERIEPLLGVERPTILHSYPASLAALARLHPADPRVAERFELFVAGLELANGFGELTDSAEQRRRFERDMQRRQALYGTRFPVDEDFIAAVGQLPPETAGIALGFDRLVMLTTGASRIEDVLWAPVE
jgi:lysyl-tRNA synthetase class 2